MKPKIKHCVVVPIFLSGKLLVAIDLHEGEDIIDVFGGVVKGGESSFQTMQRAIPGIQPAAPKPSEFGHFVDVVTKPDGITELRVDVYRCELLPGEYVISSERRTECLTREQLAKDPRNRRNIRLFDRFFDANPLSLKIKENQMGAWIDATITEWVEG